MATKPMVFLMVPMFTCADSMKVLGVVPAMKESFLTSVGECKPD
jgi:hypothetical protein